MIQRKDWEIETFYNTTWKNKDKKEQFVEPEVGMPLVQKSHFA